MSTETGRGDTEGAVLFMGGREMSCSRNGAAEGRTGCPDRKSSAIAHRAAWQGQCSDQAAAFTKACV